MHREILHLESSDKQIKLTHIFQPSQVDDGEISAVLTSVLTRAEYLNLVSPFLHFDLELRNMYR